MSTIPPALPTNSAPVSAPQAPTTAVVSAGSDPKAVQALNDMVNQVIDAKAVAGSANGQLQLTTDAGVLQVKLPMTVPPDANLTLLVTGNGNPPLLKVVTLNGLPVLPSGQVAGGLNAAAGQQGLTNILLNALDSAGQGPNAAARDPLAALLAGKSDALALGQAGKGAGGILATVMFANQQGGPSALPGGTSFMVRIVSTDFPAGQTAPGATLPGTQPGAPGTPAGGTAGGFSLLNGLPVTGGAAADPSALARLASQAYGGTSTADPGRSGGTPAQTMPGSPLNVPGQAPVAAPGIAVPAAPNAPTDGSDLFGQGSDGQSGSANLPKTLLAVIAPNSNAGRPLAQTSLGLIALDLPPDLPAGTRLTLETLGDARPTTAQPHAAQTTTGQPGTAAAPGWQQMLDTLRQADPQAAQSLMQRLPVLGANFAPALITLAAAVQSGSLKSLLGNEIGSAAGKGDRRQMLEKLDASIAELRGDARLPSTGNDGWQTLLLPFLAGSQLEQIRLTVRQPPQDEEEEKGREEKGMRFLIDLSMSNLGGLQFDGLVKRKAKQFDLIVRSRDPLTQDIRHGITSIFLNALDGMGMTGGTSFLQTPNFVQPIPVSPAAPTGLTA